MGTISQSSSETPFKLSRFTVELGHLEKILFTQASACIASVNAKKSKWRYLTQVPIGQNFKISETQQIIYH